MDTDTTIAAIATASGPAARGVIRLSGRHTLNCLTSVLDDSDAGLLAGARRATVFSVNWPLPYGRTLACDLWWWPDARSYTRQPSAEIHTVGSLPLLEMILASLCRHGARLAEPGEFTLRAFLAGRIDLTQAEAVLGVIEADTPAQLRPALQQLAGGLSAPLTRLREDLIELCAQLEAGLDFADEDIEFVSRASLRDRLRDIYTIVHICRRQLRRRAAPLGPPRVVLYGGPNVGKSSLINALAGSRVALVADEPGTTRDYVTRTVERPEGDVALVDTAGFIVNSSDLDAAAVTIANSQLREARLAVLCLDSSRPLTEWERTELSASRHPNRLIVLTKSDRDRQLDRPLPCAWRTSSVTGEGIVELWQEIDRRIGALPHDAQADAVATTAERCRASLRQTAQALRSAHKWTQQAGYEELIAAELRIAMDGLAQVLGAVYSDDILDRVFSRFCIGK